MRKTKIIATIGPASSSGTVIEKLIKAGANVLRLNFSYGDYSFHTSVIKRIRDLSKKLNTPVAILQDLQGPKIRVGRLKGGQVIYLKKGNNIRITTRSILGTNSIIPTTYKNLAKDVSKGSRVLLGDGLIELKVINIINNDIVCKAISGGYIKEHIGINLPDIDVTAPSLTSKDKKDLKLGLENGVDYVALSFVRKPQDILNLKRLLYLPLF